MRAERFIETIREELTSNLPRLNIVREWLQTAKTANTHHDLNTPTTDAASAVYHGVNGKWPDTILMSAGFVVSGFFVWHTLKARRDALDWQAERGMVNRAANVRRAKRKRGKA